MFRLFASIFLSLILMAGVAQQRFMINGFGGFVIAHRTVMQNLVTGHTKGGELAWEKTFRGTRSWHDKYRYPSAGFSVLGLDLGNPQKLGTAFAITPYLKLPLTANNDHLSFKFGLGLGMLTKHFDRLENHKNVAIGSAFNASIVLGLWYKVPFGSSMALQSGIQLQHFSNGSFRSPNLGVNLPMIALGIQFGRQKRVPLSEVETIPETAVLDSVTHYYISPRFGIKEILSTGNHKYLTYALHLSRLKALSFKYSYTVFLDVLYNSSLEEELAERDLKLKPLQYAQLGFGGGFENTYGNFAVYLQMAAYLYSKQPEVGRFYHRLGIKHNLGNKGYISFGLKSHFAKADYIELGCGFRLR